MAVQTVIGPNHLAQRIVLHGGSFGMLGAQGHVGRFKHLHNPAARHDCRVLIFGDSYAYDAHLAAWFALQCRDVWCAWQVGLQQPLIDQLAPDVVIGEMTERFVTRLPVDQL